ncbi:MAG TPA: ribosome silencing factor [Spirochaetes bacterium]|nr:ribosome silencing factor [Spirochaetota bacterium]
MTKEQVRDYALSIAELLSSKKGRDVLVIDIEQINSIADFMVIATADSNLHQGALARTVDDKLHDLGIKKFHALDTSTDSPWILMDCGMILINLFTDEGRTFYSLEKLWGDGEVIYEDSSSERELKIY